jgi:hypothetical protein
MADALDLGSSAARRGGSSPPSRNPMKSKSYADLTQQPMRTCAQIVAEVWRFSFWDYFAAESEVGSKLQQGLYQTHQIAPDRNQGRPITR